MTIFSDLQIRFGISVLVCLAVLAGVYYVSPAEARATAVVLALLLAYWVYGDLKNAKRDDFFKRNSRGRTMKTFRDIVKQVKEEAAAGSDGILWGRLRLNRQDAVNHFCVVGAVGSGKTLTLRMLMNDQFPRIKEGSDSRALVYDAKQDMVPIIGSMNLHCPVILLNPFDRRCNVWNMAVDIDSPATARQFADTLVPSEEKESNPFFPAAVRELLTAVVTALILQQKNTWTFRDVLLVMRSKQVLREVLNSHEVTQDVARNFLECSEVTWSGIAATMATKLGPFEPIAAAWERIDRRPISIKDWLISNAVLILGNDERVRATLDALNRLFVAIAAQQILTLPESATRLNWLIFDEFAEAGKLSGLESLILRGRSKGCAVVLGFQDIEHVQHVYQEKLANALVGQCGNKCFLRMESPQTAEWAQKCVGDVERTEVTVSHTHSGQGVTTSESFQKQTRPQVMASEFMELPASPNTNRGLEGVYLTRSKGLYTTAYKPDEWKRLIGTIKQEIRPSDPVPTHYQLLTPFSPQDFKRLGIKVPKLEPKVTENGYAPDMDMGRMRM